jgi:hypothetical protein
MKQLNTWLNLRVWGRRQMRLGSVLVGMGIVLVSFQNCRMSTDCEKGTGGDGCPNSTSTSVETSAANSGSSEATIGRTPGSSREGVEGSPSASIGANTLGGTSRPAVLGGGSASGAPRSSGGITAGGGSQGSPPSGGAGTPGGSGTSTVFRFLTDLKSKEVEYNGYSELGVLVAGGTPPYSYQWFKDDQPLTSGTGNYGAWCSTGYSCQLDIDSYSKEGRYKVVVKDSSSNPRTLTSSIAVVSVMDPAGPCGAGNYVMYTGGNAFGNVTELFQNPRGTFLISGANDAISYMVPYPRSFPITIVNYMPAATFKQSVPFPSLCESMIPNINTSGINNPGSAAFGDGGIYGCGTGNGCGYHREGAVTLECSNARWRLVTNTCRWVRDVPVDEGGSRLPPNDG